MCVRESVDGSGRESGGYGSSGSSNGDCGGVGFSVVEYVWWLRGAHLLALNAQYCMVVLCWYRMYGESGAVRSYLVSFVLSAAAA